MRGACSANGTTFYTAGETGVYYVSSIGATTGTLLGTSSDNTRSVQIVSGNLYVMSGSATPGKGVTRLGTGLPTTTSQTYTTIQALTTSGNSFFFADLDAAQGIDNASATKGVDTLYVTDGTNLAKYAYASSAWTLKNTVALTGMTFFTGSVSGSTVTIYASTSTAVQKLTDSAGYNVNNNGTFASFATPTAGTGKFVGLALAPVAASSGTITAVTLTNALTNTYGTASTGVAYTATGTGLTGQITNTPVAGFEFSTNNTDWTTNATAVNTNTTVYVRTAATRAAGTNNSTAVVTLSSPGASSANVTTSSSSNVVSAAPLTITANDVTNNYGAGLSTPVSGSTNFTSSGLVNSNTISSVTISYTAGTSSNSAVGVYTNAVVPSAAVGITTSNYSITYASNNLTISAVAPGVPTITGITAGNLQLSVAISAPSSDGGARVTNYQYSTNGSSGTFTAFSPAQTNSPLTISNLVASTQYSISLKAVNSVGAGSASTATNGTPYTTPAAPTSLSVTNGNGQVTIAFTAGTNNGSSITNYQYSIDGGTSFTAFSPVQNASPVTITGLSNGTTYSLALQAVNAAGAGTASTNVSGTPTAPASPTISVVPATLASALTTTYGTSSTEASFSVSGAALTGDLTVTAPTGYEISKTSGGTFTDSVSLTASSSSVASTTIYARIKANAGVSGTYNGVNFSVTGEGASTQNVATSASGNVVSAKGVTITGLAGVNKVYDRTTEASTTGTAIYSGLVNSESFSVTGDPVATFANANVGTTKVVTINGYLAPSADYTLTADPTVSADITAKALTIPDAAVTAKTYDNTTAATITGTLSGVISGDTVTLNGTGTFASAGVGAGISVTSTSTLGGADAGNYSLTQPTGLTGDITTASQTITFTNNLTGLTVGSTNALTATASSGLTVSYTVANTNIATLSGTNLIAVAPGSTTVVASQSGNANYSAATPVTNNVSVVAGPTTLAAGDIAVIGYNAVANNPDTITLLILKTLNAGTVFYVCDNEVATEGGTTFSDTTESEATFTVSAGQTIPAGTVVTLPWGNQTVTDSRFTWTGHTSGGLGVSSGNFDDGIYIYTGTSATATPTAFIYFVKGGSSATSAGNLPAGLSYGTTAINPTAGASRYKISGAVYAGPAETLLPAIGNITNNWEAVAPGATTDWSFNTQYLLPVISGLSPSSVLPSGADFTLVINGSNFYTTTQVTLGGASKTVTYVNSGQLTIPVTAAEIASAGSLAVVVTNPTPGGGTASQSLAVNSGPSLALTPPADNSAFASTIQTATTSRTFKVAGSNLTTGITLAPPTGFEISLDDVSFSTSILLLQTDGVVAETTLYLRFNPTAVQSYSGNVTAATEGVTPSAAFAVLGNSAAPNEGKLTGTFADGSVALTGTAPTAGTVTEYIVLAKVGSAIADVPSGDGSAYSASAVYGSGAQIGNSYVVYKGSTPPSVYQVTGLTNRLRYYFTMYSRVATSYSTGNSTNGFPFAVLGNVITQWDFNSKPLDDPANLGTGSNLPSVGSGSSILVVGNVLASYGSGLQNGGSTDSVLSDNSGAQTSGYPAASAESGTSGVVFSVSTVGKQGIVVYWDVRHSNTSSRYLQFQYSKDGGTTWTNYSATGDLTEGGYYVGNTGDTWFQQRSADLSGDTGVNNNANFAFRIVTVFAPSTSAYTAAATGSTYGTAGTLRFDMVTVTGVNGDSNSAPTQIGLSATAIAENNAVNAVVGTLSTTDVDSGDRFTYSLAVGTGDTDNASFNIEGASLRASVAFNFEDKSSYSIRVRTTDSGGGTFEKVFAITVTNVSDSPADYKVDWLAANGLEAGLSWDSDPNNVGYSLATAYAFGLDPRVRSGSPITLVSSPTGSVKVVYLRRDISSGVTYAVKTGTDLAIGLNGNDAIINESASQPSPAITGYTRYEATYTPSAPATKGFVKVQAIVP